MVKLTAKGDAEQRLNALGSACAGLKTKTAGTAAMDDLDRRSVEVAISILQAEAESPGSQKPASIGIAKQILAQLQPAELHLGEISSGSVVDSAISGSTRLAGK